MAEPCKAPAENLRIQLSPLGVITGRVVDQDGVPLRYVNIYALSTRIQNGLAVTHNDRSVTTDDRGMYRLWNLSPGKYVIKASGFAVSTVSFLGDSTPAASIEAYPTTYSGGGQTRDSATPLEIKPGGEATADFTLAVDRGFRLRGTLSGIASRTTVKFEVVANNDASPVRVTLNNETGRFEVAGLSPGSYSLRATQDKSVAELPITMPASDVSNVEMRLEPPVDISVHTRFTNEPPAPIDTLEGLRPGGACIVQLQSLTGGTNAPTPRRDMSVIAGVSPGRYHAIAQCFNARATSMTLGSQDLVANPEVVIAPGSVPAIELVAAYGGGVLRGEIEGEGEAGTIVLVPGTGGDPISFPVSPKGFMLSGLAPGTYQVFAFAKEVEYRNREFVRALSGGVTVQIEDGKEAKVKIPAVIP